MGESIAEVYLMSAGYAILALTITFLTVFYEFSYKRVYQAELNKKTEQILYIKSTN